MLNSVNGAANGAHVNGVDHHPGHADISGFHDQAESRDVPYIPIPDRNVSGNIHDARRGVPGYYCVDPEHEESAYFYVKTIVFGDSGRRRVQVYLLEHWQAGECEHSVELPGRGERRPFLPLSVLFGNFDESRFPKGLSEDVRDDLLLDAELICDGVRRYEAWQNSQRRQRRGRNSRRD